MQNVVLHAVFSTERYIAQTASVKASRHSVGAAEGVSLGQKSGVGADVGA